MIQQHWDIHNTFEHYGRGDFGMLGWDALKDTETLPLFQFGELDHQQMQQALLQSLPAEIFSLVSEHPVTIDALRHAFANRTTARFSDLDEMIVKLARENEFEIIGPDGKRRSQTYSRLAPTDQVVLPRQQLILGVSRRP